MGKALSGMLEFLRGNPVLCVAALVAIASMVAVPPNSAYIDYIDWRVLGLLFCLMACVQGATRANVFSKTGELLLGKRMSMRSAAGFLVGLCFFTSMLVTNDVALITFVPFTLYVFAVAGKQREIAFVVVLQTIAANLGSMATPMGNPQNLYLYTHYNLGFLDMALCIVPFVVISAALLAACTVVLLPKGPLAARESSHSAPSKRLTDPTSPANQAAPLSPIDAPHAGLFAALFVLSVLAVLNVVPLPITLAVVLFATIIFDRQTLLKVDYGLLATFVCFFVFSGNIANIALVRDALTGLMSAAPFAASLVASQIISNVPAATLLAPFTSAWQSLMLGVDLGGLGTPVASLASLISLEFYRRSNVEGAGPGRYLAIFTLLNVAFLVINILFGIAIGSI